MTRKLCAEHATNGEWKYFGVEYGTVCSSPVRYEANVIAAYECWLGNELNPLSTSADPATCDTPCNGNMSQICGGSARLNLYQRPEPEPTVPLTCGRLQNPDMDLLACKIRGFATPAGEHSSFVKVTIAECASSCASTNGCISYAWEMTSLMCSVYTATVWASIGDLASRAGSDYSSTFLDDIACWSCEESESQSK
jgi:hypothetical protein